MTLLTYQNSKLKHQLIFNLPVSLAICGRQCAGCYALKAQRRFPSVLASCERKYQASLLPSFASTIISEITNFKRPFTAVRLHSSGEFHSQAYIIRKLLAEHLASELIPYINVQSDHHRLTNAIEYTGTICVAPLDTSACVLNDQYTYCNQHFTQAEIDYAISQTYPERFI